MRSFGPTVVWAQGSHPGTNPQAMESSTPAELLRPAVPVQTQNPTRDAQFPVSDRALANALPQIIWTCDAQGRLDWVNDRWFELTGLSEAETLNHKGALVAVHPDDRATLARHWAHALETSSVVEFEYRILDTSRGYRWHVARVAPVRGARGEVIRWVAAVFDIHDHRRTEDALRASERKFDSVLHLSSVPMSITRRSDGVYLFVNEAFSRLTGYTREEVVGRSSVELGMLTVETRAAAAAHFGGRDGRSVETGFRVKDGRVLTLMLSSAHIEIDGVACFLKTATDLTERRAMEDALRESEAQARAAENALRRANQQKDEFLALLSHELRNPLTPILTSVRVLEARIDAESRDDLDVIVRQVKHVSRLVDDLLDVERMARGALTLTRAPLEPAAVVARAVAATAPLFIQRAHRLDIDIPEEGLAVDADDVRLMQIFDNLLSNAALYTPPRGTIQVSGAREGDAVVLRVRDTGRGIEPFLLHNLFEPFVRGSRGADRAEGGLGVGLSLVRALTELHGGTVVAHSDGPGCGSEFTVRLPAAAPASNRSMAPLNSAAPKNDENAAGTRVLIVDDHRDVAKALARLLRLLGYDVRTELNSLDALAAAEAFRPEIALLDIGLPAMDGYRLAAELRGRLGHKAPVLIALSGYDQPQDLRRTHDAGFATYLTKPIDSNELVDALTRFARV